MNILPKDIIHIIYEYAYLKPVKLLDWIDPNKIDWYSIQSNRSVYLDRFLQDNIEEHGDKYNWSSLCANPNTMELVNNNFIINPNIINIKSIYLNEKSLKLIKILLSNNFSNINCKFIQPKKVTWEYLIKNKDSIYYIIHLIKKYSYIDNLIEYFIHNMDMINYTIREIASDIICSSDDIKMIETIMNVNVNYLNMKELCKNPNAINIINKLIDSYPEKINWKSIAENPSIHMLKIGNVNFSNRAMKLLARNPNGINIWKERIDDYIQYIDELCYNDSLDAINILKSIPLDRFYDMDIFILSGNKHIMEIADKLCDRLDWFTLSLNCMAIPIIEKNILHNGCDKIHSTICGNENAIHIIKNLCESNNMIAYDDDGMFSIYLTSNTSIFEIDEVKYDEEIDKLFNLV
jgi:hypothetical protein